MLHQFMRCIRTFVFRYSFTQEAVCGLPAGRQFRYPKLKPHLVFGGGVFRSLHRAVPGVSIFTENTQSGLLGDENHLRLARNALPTIYALSTAPGRSAIAIVRCSGSLCLEIYKALCPGTASPKPRYASIRTLYSPDSITYGRHILDPEALILYFPAPRTTTGEDVLEFHIHGGNAIVKAILAAIPTAVAQLPAQEPVIRYAEPGEFTRRAFYNGRLDLTQVEALGDTLTAETEQQRYLAVRGMNSALHERYEAWRRLLLAARGELEALIDFSEDQHFDDSPAEFVKSVSSQVISLQSLISSSLRNAAKGELLRSGVTIALLGAPNAGKSSLLNRIVGREAAIVSAEAGTTRDVVEVNVDIGGFFCKFGDLAGVRGDSASNTLPSVGEVEKEGIRRAKANALSADVVVVVTPIERDATAKDGYSAKIDPNIAEMLQTQVQPHQKIIHVLNKVDLVGQSRSRSIDSLIQGFGRLVPDTKSVFPISCLLANAESSAVENDPSGLQHFLSELTQELKTLTKAEAVDPEESRIVEFPDRNRQFDESLGSTERQCRLLEQCKDYLTQFLIDIRANPLANFEKQNLTTEDQEAEIDIVLAAERLRAAAECLAKITGRGEGGDVEEVLGVVFEKFCVGK